MQIQFTKRDQSLFSVPALLFLAYLSFLETESSVLMTAIMGTLYFISFYTLNFYLLSLNKTKDVIILTFYLSQIIFSMVGAIFKILHLPGAAELSQLGIFSFYLILSVFMIKTFIFNRSLKGNMFYGIGGLIYLVAFLDHLISFLPFGPELLIYPILAINLTLLIDKKVEGMNQFRGLAFASLFLFFDIVKVLFDKILS